MSDKRGPSARDPQVKPPGKNLGDADFSGQDGYEQVATEGAADAPELAGMLTRSFAPTIDDPGVNTKSTVFQSDDPRLHLSRMSGS